MSDDVMVTAAIDFGTMYSGYSYSLKSNPDDIRVNKAWAEGVVGRTVTKAPTCVLLEQTPDSDKPGEEKIKLLAFGFLAQNKYRIEGKKQNQYFYDEFKMELYKDRNLGTYKKMIKSYDKKHECEATTLFSLTLRFLKDQLLDDMNANLENKLEAKNIQWVLTVPAIWSDAAKRFMRKCAQEGGVVDDEDSERLLVSLEPECAAMYCRGLKADSVKDPPPDFTNIPEQTKYLVVDCGGGTVDITAHETKDEDDICELFARSSKDWGGRNIDRKFEEKLQTAMGEELYKKFNEELAPKFLDLKIAFEQSKGSIKFNDPTYSLNLTMPGEFFQLCTEVTGNAFDKHIKGSGDKNVTFRNGFLSFNRIAIGDMFQPVVDRICNHVVNLLQQPRAKDMEYTFLVGGFSDCGALQLTMQELIRKDSTLNKINIITPVDAVLTIMKGAVKFGYNPQAISSRRSRLTYGTCVHEPFKPGVHDMHRRVIGKDGNLYCTGIFYPLLGKDEEILQDDVLDFVFQPLWNQQNEVEFNLYSADKYKDKIKHVDDAGVAKETIKINLDPNAKYDEKPIRLLIYFGSTELHIQVVDDNDPHKKKGSASLDLLDA